MKEAGDALLALVILAAMCANIWSTCAAGDAHDKALRDSTATDICQHTCERLKETFVPIRQPGCHCVDPFKVHKVAP